MCQKKIHMYVYKKTCFLAPVPCIICRLEPSYLDMGGAPELPSNLYLKVGYKTGIGKECYTPTGLPSPP